eukprot:1869717-Amphidinium_carterae.1
MHGSQCLADWHIQACGNIVVSVSGTNTEADVHELHKRVQRLQHGQNAALTREGLHVTQWDAEIRSIDRS